MEKQLYLECASGISGDMAVASLLDLGADRKVLDRALQSIKLEDEENFSTEILRVNKNGIDCLDFNVILKNDNHDHDMNYLFNNDNHIHNEHIHHEHTHTDSVQHDEESPTFNEHSHIEHNHHKHRSLSDIKKIIDNAELTNKAKDLANKIFYILAESEAKAHGTTIEEVHFHEVGAIDSIVDIISIAVCFDNLAIDRVYVPKMFEGQGTIRCQHGILNVPVPAVLNIVSKYDLPISIGNENGEFITPTGAAFVAAVKTNNSLPETFHIQKIGLGAGKRNYQRPSILRAMLISTANSTESDCIYKLESNIDDCTGENLDFAMEQLFSKGALDVSFIPCYMKKNRPAYLVNVICNQDKIDDLEQVLFEQTTTIGIRRSKMERTKLKRENVTIESKWGQVNVKCVYINNKKRFYPEYESISSICRKYNLSYNEVYIDIVTQCASLQNH